VRVVGLCPEGRGSCFRRKERAATVQVVAVWCSGTAENFSTRSASPVSSIAEAGLHRRCFSSRPADCLTQQFLDFSISKLVAELTDPHVFTLD